MKSLDPVNLVRRQAARIHPSNITQHIADTEHYTRYRGPLDLREPHHLHTRSSLLQRDKLRRTFIPQLGRPLQDELIIITISIHAQPRFSWSIRDHEVSN